MRVLISVSTATAPRPDDFCFVPDGELVTPTSFVCANGCRCGCARAFSGIECMKGTTQAQVVEMAPTEVLNRLEASARLVEDIKYHPDAQQHLVDEMQELANRLGRTHVGTQVRIANFTDGDYELEIATRPRATRAGKLPA